MQVGGLDDFKTSRAVGIGWEYSPVHEAVDAGDFFGLPFNR
jgi:hypothetical protein